MCNIFNIIYNFINYLWRVKRMKKTKILWVLPLLALSGCQNVTTSIEEIKFVMLGQRMLMAVILTNYGMVKETGFL